MVDKLNDVNGQVLAGVNATIIETEADGSQSQKKSDFILIEQSAIPSTVIGFDKNSDLQQSPVTEQGLSFLIADVKPGNYIYIDAEGNITSAPAITANIIIKSGEIFFMPDEDGLIVLGSSAAKDVQISQTDSTPDRVMLNGAFGLGGITFRANNDWLLALAGNRTGFFNQGGGEFDNRYTNFGVGIHMQYGENADTNFTGNLYLDSTGNVTADWVQIEKVDGQVINKTQKLYGPLNKPTAGDVGAVPLYPAGEVRDVITMKGLRQIYTSSMGNPLELGHLSGVAGDFYLDIHTGGIEEFEDFTTRFTFRVNGNTYLTHDFSADTIGSVGEIQCGSGAVRLLIDGNILGPSWTAGAGNLYSHIEAKRDEAINNAYANYVSGVQLGAEAWRDYGGGSPVKGGAGEVLTGLQEQQDDNEIHGYWFKPVMNRIAGTWWTVAGLRVEITTDYYKATIPKSGLSEFKDFVPFRRKETPLDFVDFMDENNYLWSEAQKALRGNVFISYDKDGVIRCIAELAWMLTVMNYSVVGLDELPNGCKIDGTWIYNGSIVYQDANLAAGQLPTNPEANETKTSSISEAEYKAKLRKLESKVNYLVGKIDSLEARMPKY